MSTSHADRPAGRAVTPADLRNGAYGIEAAPVAGNLRPSASALRQLADEIEAGRAAIVLRDLGDPGETRPC